MADVGEAGDAEDDRCAAEEACGAVIVGVVEGFGGLLLERLRDGEEGVCVGVREGVVDVVGDELLEDGLEVFECTVVEWVD